MKIMQLNAWGGRLLDVIIDVINREDPDIVCLQEISSNPSLPPKNPFYCTLEAISSRSKLGHVYHSPTGSWRLMDDYLVFGNAILCKHPFASTETFWTRLDFGQDLVYGKDDYNRRNLQHVTIEHLGQQLNIFNHHAYHESGNKDGGPEFDEQMKKVASQIDKTQGPTILCGDFNLAPHSPNLRHIKDSLTDLPSLYNVKTTRTILKNRDEVCDYIFVNKQIQVQRFLALDDPISDHKALLLEFDIA